MIDQTILYSTPRISRVEAARYIGLAPSTLARWAVEGRYSLPYYRIGNRTLYEVRDLDELLARHRVGRARVR